MKRLIFKSVLHVLIILGVYGARAEQFNQFLGFGDSTFDSGYFRYNSTGLPPYDAVIAQAVGFGDTGAFVANGIMNSVMLANKFCLTAVPVGIAGGGTNYANGGSYTMTTGVPFPKSVSCIMQIKNYLKSVNGIANPCALYIVKTGDNDLSYVTPDQPKYLSECAAALTTELALLQKAGACTIMVPNSYNVAIWAGLGGDIAPGNARKYAVSNAYQLLKWSDLCAAGVHFIPADIDSLCAYVVHNPTCFGFTPESVLSSSGPALKNPYPYNSALTSYPLTTTELQAFLFVDKVHFATAGQRLEADYEHSLLIAPSQISLIMESAMQKDLAVSAAIQRQVDLTWQERGTSGTNFWVVPDAKYLKLKNTPCFAHAHGVSFGGTIGVDHRTQGGAIFGVALTAGTQKQKFSTCGGHFDQTVETPSLYAAYKGEHVWCDAVASGSAYQNKINRHVPLGMFIDENCARPAGYSLALMAGIGGDFKSEHVATGPVAYVELQHVRLREFTETGRSGVTALSFARQTWNSCVSQLGWRVLGDVGKWQPFAQARWNHEWADKHHKVTTKLTSVSAPSYTMAAAPVASNWGDAWLGTAYQVNDRVALRGAFLTTFCDRQVASYGGELGLNVSF